MIGLSLLMAVVWTISRATEQVVLYPSVDQFGKPLAPVFLSWFVRKGSMCL